ncbi:MAG: hypothetical protein KC419_26685 [Anaerolineales bacterium]|nr:hypothetical protein [Anaerolineales bacterium]
MDRNASSLQFFLDRAEAVVSQEKRTRLGSHAIRQRVRRYNANRIQEALNTVYASHASRLHPAWRLAQTLSRSR